MTLVFTVTLLSEWEMIEDVAGSLLIVDALLTDGVVMPSAPSPSRRLLVLGDSLSSGVGCGFTSVNGPCGAGVLQDDASKSWGALLCDSFAAECEVVAASGITISGRNYNLPLCLPWALGGMGQPAWPAAQRVPWDAASHPVDAVLAEIGENDKHLNVTNAELVAAYANLTTSLTTTYKNKRLPIWFVIANHEAGQSAAMLIAVSNLSAAGFNVAFLNATSPNSLNGTDIDNGCAGHPSAAQQAYAAARARPTIAKALGWD
jgi:hypothetical protein